MNTKTCYRKYFVIIFLSIFILAGVEVVVRMFLYGRSIAPQIFQNNPDVQGYELLPNTNSKCFLSGRFVNISIDNKGHRLVSNAPKDFYDSKIHLIGDSQVFGWGLSDKETIGYQLQEIMKSKFRVINHGVPGYGPYAYLKVLESIPVEDWVVIIHSEQNDLWDAYTAKSTALVRCGHLVSDTFLGKNLPCWILNSQIFQIISAINKRYIKNKRVLPLGFDSHSVVASKVLIYRIHQLYKNQKKLRGLKIIFTFIPWECILDSRNLHLYNPRVQNVIRQVRFQDDCDIEQRFLQSANSETFYLPFDDHLSPTGAKTLVQLIAKVIRQRQYNLTKHE